MRIESIQVAIAFKKQDDILYILGQEIVKFQQKFNAQKQLTNVPESTPPELPRLSILVPNFIVNIALNRIDIISNIPPNISNDQKTSLNYIYKIVEEVFDTLLNGKIEYQWIGIVINTEYSKKATAKTPLIAVEPIYDIILNIPRKERDLASFNLQFGFVEKPFYINYFIGGYEKANFVFNGPVNTGVSIDLTNAKKEIIDTGISIKVDVNNKIQETKNQKNIINDFTSIIRKCELLLDSVIEDLNLEKILKE